MFDSIKRYYHMDKYGIEQVKIFVVARWITVDEFKQITGKDYETN